MGGGLVWKEANLGGALGRQVLSHTGLEVTEKGFPGLVPDQLILLNLRSPLWANPGLGGVFRTESWPLAPACSSGANRSGSDGTNDGVK